MVDISKNILGLQAGASFLMVPLHRKATLKFDNLGCKYEGFLR
jgi:hypothetical protein